MAVRKVVIRECDRCGKKDELLESEVPENSTEILSITLKGESVISYADLCDRCDQRVTNVVNALKNARGTRAKKEGDN